VAAKAYVLIETAVGKSKDVVADVTQLDGVELADSVTGPYDVIAIIEAESMIEIGELVADRIGSISGISRTVTCLAINPS
jgi:DNA-binding Lrp family transcriptional regulator